MLCGGLRKDGRRAGISLPIDVEVGVGVSDRPMSFSDGFTSGMVSLLV